MENEIVSDQSTHLDQLHALGFKDTEDYDQHQAVMAASKTLAKCQIATGYEVYAGYVQLKDNHIRIGFKTPINATQAEKDAAFLAALSEVATLNYLCIGSSCCED